mgnify:CR=1 FL=1
MGETCGGCKFHSFPYKARLPILINGKRQTKTFNCKEDVWNVVDLLIKEVKEMNTKGKEFDVSESINAQLPFFSCRNNVFDRDIQKDIQRYIYCKELGISPYNGSYGEQPAMWIDTFFIIKSSFAKKESSQINKIKDKKV